jgi:hypothetical protein
VSSKVVVGLLVQHQRNQENQFNGEALLNTYKKR